MTQDSPSQDRPSQDRPSSERPSQDRPAQYRQTRFRRPPGATEIFLVRHGESEAVVPGATIPDLDGHDDPALAPQGREQALRVADRLQGQQIDAIYVTSLRRTQQTAAPLAQRIGVTPVIVPELREVFLGEWEGGRFRQHVAHGDPLAQRMFAEQRWDVIPGAESTEAFGARLREGIGRIVDAHPDQRVVVVVHGGVIGELVRQAVDGRRGFAFVGADNGSITHLVVQGDTWTVRRFNDTGHLGGFDLDPEPELPES